MNLPDLDKIIHERTRLRILASLAAQPLQKSSFLELKEKLEMTAGNLSSQLSVLESTSYVSIEKGFHGRKPFTEITLTLKGSKAFDNYLDALDSMIASLKPRKE